MLESLWFSAIFMSATLKYFVKTCILKHILKKKKHTYFLVDILSSIQKRSASCNHSLGDFIFIGQLWSCISGLTFLYMSNTHSDPERR